MKRPLQIALAIALAAGSIDVLALGLGTIEVKSRLNEPLVAEIPVIQAGPGEAQGLIVQLASSEDFERVGLSRTRVSMPLEFSLHSSGERMVIRVTTKEAVREPFLDFLVEANWPNGRLLREYTVLLDPPVMAPSRSAQVKTPVPATPASEPAPAAVRAEAARAAAATPAPVAAAPEPTVAQAPPPPPPPAPSAAASEPTSPPTTPAAAQITASGEFGPVDAGQTLSEIARATRVDDTVSINQMMIALLRHNPDAFYQDNINALKRGAILRIPSADEVRATAAEQEAAQLARAHIDEWRTASAPTLITDSAPPSAVASPAADVSTPSRAGPSARSERVALVPPRSGDAGGGAAAASRGVSGAGDAQLRHELARAAEELETERQEAAELRSRLSDLEETNAKSARMIALQNDQLAQLQAQLEQMRAAAAGDGSPAASDAASDAVTDGQQLAAADSATDDDSTGPGVDTDDPVSVADATGPAADVLPAEGESSAAVPGTGNDAGMEIWGNGDVADIGDATAQDDTIMSDAATSLAGAGPEAETIALDAEAGAPAGDVAMPAVAQSPRPVAATSWYQRPVVLGLGALALLLAALGLRSRRNAQLEPKPRRKSVADQFGEAADETPVTTHDAEISALREQLAENRTDAGLHLELASLYYSLADREAFVAAARDMHAHVDSNSDEWAAVCSMGQELAADEPLFAASDALDSDATAVGSDEDFSPDMTGAMDADQDPSLDYDALLGDLQADAPVEELVADSLVLDEPSDSIDDDFGIAPRSEDADTQSDPASSFLASMDGERDAGLDFPGAEPAAGIPEAPAIPDTGLSFDMDDMAEATHDEDPDPLAVAAPAAEDPQGHSSPHDMADDSMTIDAATAEALSLDDDLGSLTDLPGIDGDSNDNPTGIKLDLARAYLDMGDPDGAKAMLEEVLAEGNEAQQEDARALIERIG